MARSLADQIPKSQNRPPPSHIAPPCPCFGHLPNIAPLSFASTPLRQMTLARDTARCRSSRSDHRSRASGGASLGIDTPPPRPATLRNISQLLEGRGRPRHGRHSRFHRSFLRSRQNKNGAPAPPPPNILNFTHATQWTQSHCVATHPFPITP